MIREHGRSSPYLMNVSNVKRSLSVGQRPFLRAVEIAHPYDDAAGRLEIVGAAICRPRANTVRPYGFYRDGCGL